MGGMRHFGDRDFGVYTNGLRCDTTLNLAVEPEGADLKLTFGFADVWLCLDLSYKLGQSGGRGYRSVFAHGHSIYSGRWRNQGEKDDIGVRVSPVIT